MQSGGDVYGASTAGQGNAERQRVGGRVSSQSGPQSPEQGTLCACLACCVSYYKPRPQGLQAARERSYQEFVKKTKKKITVAFPQYSYPLCLGKKKEARSDKIYESNISITAKAPSQLHERIFNLSTDMGVHLMPGVLLTSCHLALNLNPG